MTDEQRKLDSGAKGGLGGLAAVAALLAALVAWQSRRPWLYAPLMAAAGTAGLALCWHVAVRRRRLFSAVEWLVLSVVLVAFFALLRADPSERLRQYYAEDPSRQQTALLVAAGIAVIGFVSLWMLHARGPDDHRRKDS